MDSRNRVPLLLALILISGTLVWALRKQPSPSPTPVPAPVTPPAPTSAPAPTGAQETPPVEEPKPIEPASFDLHLSDDAKRKSGDFWLEQTLALPAPDGPLCELYLSYNKESGGGVRARLSRSELVLERSTEGAEPWAKPEVLGQAPVPATAMVKLQATLGALWRKGELSLWLDGSELLTYRAPLDLTGPSAARLAGPGARLRERHTTALGAVAFRDTFMRDRAGAWVPLSGRWELTGMTFPERSANPFALRAVFSTEGKMGKSVQSVDADELFEGRMQGAEVGLGIQMGQEGGLPTISRLTGGSPAAHAGLQEDDVIMAVDGISTLHSNVGQVYQLLNTANNRGHRTTITVLRSGAKELLDYTVVSEDFKWGTPMEGTPLQPVDDKGEALIVSGDGGWADYAAEVAAKPLGPGGFGLAVAVTSPQDYLILRWLSAPTARLELVRVHDGAEVILGSKQIAYRPYEFYLLALDWHGEEVTASLDQNEVFKARVQGLKRGKVGLFATRGQPVFFDDVAVFTERGELAGARKTERTINTIFSADQDMEAWANPTLDWERSETSPWATHHARFPGEKIITLHQPKYDELRVDAGGYTLVLHGRIAYALAPGLAGAPTTRDLPLNGPGTDMATAKPKRVTIVARPGLLALDVDGKRNEFPIQGPPPDDHIALSGLKNLGDPATVRLTSTNALEYTFDRAPWDWKVQSGRWGLLNKFICDPRWSWFGGRAPTLGALWNKQVFSGDVTLEAYLAVLMVKEQPPYENASDFNLTICGDGVHFDRGYTLIVAGENNRWTRLYRNGKQVAETVEERFRLPGDRVRQPDKPELHQRWFHLKLEKIGNKIAFYNDGKQAFEFTDPEPLTGGRAGVWTVRNGMMMARARIAASEIKPGPLESAEAEIFDGTRTTNLYEGEVFTRVAPTALPAAIRASLGAPADAFVPTDADAGKAEPNEKPAAWTVTNGISGGPFALLWNSGYLKPGARDFVRFAIRLDPGAAVDFYLRDFEFAQNNHQGCALYRWRLSGPASAEDTIPLLGSTPVPCDGRWHTVELDLSKGWARMLRERGTYPDVDTKLRPAFGLLDNSAYGLAGMGVNHLGVSYSVSELKFFNYAERDHEAPSVSEVVWPFDAKGDGRHVVIHFNEPGGSGIDPGRLDLRFNNSTLGRDEYEFEPFENTVSIDLLAMHGFKPISEGEKFNLVVKGADRAGNELKESPEFNWTYSITQVAEHKMSAAAPEIEVLVDGSPANLARGGPLDTDTHKWEPAAGDKCTTHRVPDAPPGAAHPYSYEVRAQADGSQFLLTLPDARYDLTRWPYLELVYRVPKEAPLNLRFLGGGTRGVLVLTDIGDGDDWFAEGKHGRVFMGPPPDFKDDGTWRRSEIPFLQMASKASPAIEDWTVSNFEFLDAPWRGNRRGMWYRFFSVKALPAGRSKGLAFNWRTRDLCPATGYATAIDEKPDTVPSTQEVNMSEAIEASARRQAQAAGQAVPENTLVMKSGWKFLHVRSKNAAGQWSETAHYKFYVDNDPPKVVKTDPPEGASFSGQTIHMQIDETHLVRPHTLGVTIGDLTLIDGDPGLRYVPQTGELIFDGSSAARVPWKAGEQVTVMVMGGTDCYGNSMREPYKFSFTAAAPAAGPGSQIAQLRWAARGGQRGQRMHRPVLAEVSLQLDFEETLGHVRALRDMRLDWLDDPKQAEFERRAARFVVLQDDGEPQILLHKSAINLVHLPELHFDYKADAGTALDLQFQVLGEWYTVKFLGAGAQEGERGAGSIEDAQADGQWHHASVNLRRLLGIAGPNGLPEVVSQVVLSAHGQPGAKRGAAFALDNLHFAPDYGAGGCLEWAADDPLGIAGYSLVIDAKPDTEAPARVSTRDTLQPFGGVNGLHYIHLRAVNQAGQWGPTRHMRIEF